MHKLFLSSVSPVFKKMFFGKFKEEEEVNTSSVDKNLLGLGRLHIFSIGLNFKGTVS